MSPDLGYCIIKQAFTHNNQTQRSQNQSKIQKLSWIYLLNFTHKLCKSAASRSSTHHHTSWSLKESGQISKCCAWFEHLLQQVHIKCIQVCFLHQWDTITKKLRTEAMFTEDTQSAGHWHCCQGLSTSEYGCQSTYAQLRRPLTACVENYHLPADHLDVRRFDSAGSHSVRHRESNLQLREHVASLPMDRSGWKFPAIQRMPTDSALLQSTFPCGTHTHTHWWLTVCVCGHACTLFWQLRPCTLQSRV